MPQEDNETAELEHSEKIGFVIFPAADQSAEIVEPGKEALDFPAPAVTAQFAAVLGTLAAAVVLVGRDEPDAVFLPEALIERIAVVGAVADHSFWFGSREALGDSGFDEFRFMRRARSPIIRFGLARVKRWATVASTSFVSCGEALVTQQATGRPWRSAIAMILLPFPRRVGPTAGPLFSPN